eukprot:9109437-Pyramimonas_sp.AAC.1
MEWPAPRMGQRPEFTAWERLGGFLVSINRQWAIESWLYSPDESRASWMQWCIDAVSFELTMTPMLDDLIHRMRTTGHDNPVLSLATDICETAWQRNSRHRGRVCGRWEAL